MWSRDATFCFCDFETTGVDKAALPIEVGCVFTDHELTVLGTYEALIRWPSLMDENGWPKHAQSAYAVHKIGYDTYTARALKSEQVATDISDCVWRYGNRRRTMTMVSDNARFEDFHMRKLFELTESAFPFHYCVWDSSLLLELTNIGDVPHNLRGSHRALMDATRLHRRLCTAYDLVRRSLLDGVVE